MQIDRRTMLAGSAALSLIGCAPVLRPSQSIITNRALAQLEAKAGGSLGVFILDTASENATGYRTEELFGMCSTFKLSLCATILKMAEQGKLKLGDILAYTKADLLPVSPVTTENLRHGGMTVEALAKATQITSDNAAANILLRRIGGPVAVTDFWRSVGDTVSRLDRYETEMSMVPPGELRDTTSPRAMAHSMARFLTTDVLTAEHREKLLGWMTDTQTGSMRIRAGLPKYWRQGDKTGTGIHKSYANKYNDVAIFWPPARPPVVVTCFYEGPIFVDEMRARDVAVLADVGRIAAAQALEWHGGLD